VINDHKKKKAPRGEPKSGDVPTRVTKSAIGRMRKGEKEMEIGRGGIYIGGGEQAHHRPMNLHPLLKSEEGH